MGNSPATWLKMEKFNSADLLPPKRGREWKYFLNNTLKKNSLLHSEKWKRLMHPNSSLGNNTQCKCNMSDLKYWEIYSEKCILELAEYWESIESWKWKVFPGICFPNTTCSTGAYGLWNILQWKAIQNKSQIWGHEMKHKQDQFFWSWFGGSRGLSGLQMWRSKV